MHNQQVGAHLADVMFCVECHLGFMIRVEGEQKWVCRRCKTVLTVEVSKEDV